MPEAYEFRSLRFHGNCRKVQFPFVCLLGFDRDWSRESSWIRMGEVVGTYVSRRRADEHPDSFINTAGKILRRCFLSSFRGSARKTRNDDATAAKQTILVWPPLLLHFSIAAGAELSLVSINGDVRSLAIFCPESECSKILPCFSHSVIFGKSVCSPEGVQIN